MVRFLSKIFQSISNDFNFLCGPSFCINYKNCQILESEDIVVLDDQNDICAWIETFRLLRNGWRFG